MRGLPVRRIASTALCAALVLGAAAPAAMAADGAAARERNVALSDAPVAGADALLAQAEGLGELGTVLTPVTELINTVRKADDGQLTAAQATEFGDAVRAAIAKITATAPVTTPALPADPAAELPAKPALPADPAAALPAKPALPADPAAALPAKPALPAAPVAALSPVGKSGDDGKAKAAADPVSDAVAALDKAVAALLAAATSLGVGQVVPAVTGVVSGLLDLLTATPAGVGLTLPTLPVEAPALPAVPAAPAVPAVPAVPALPTT
ncbi:MULTISPECIES: hypothetical protein [unclassified Streptomyces]|uniref:hypothetical protein n=1 Tax=unclassified Streptomyces TaxID=2593676 RepID=UPI0033A1CE15